jgi:hypothetical protein
VRLKAGKAVAGPSVVSAVDSIPRLHQSFTLADGRRLGFAEYGDPRGKPVLFFPGTPSGRLFHDRLGANSLGREQNPRKQARGVARVFLVAPMRAAVW